MNIVTIFVLLLIVGHNVSPGRMVQLWHSSAEDKNVLSTENILRLLEDDSVYQKMKNISGNLSNSSSLTKREAAVGNYSEAVSSDDREVNESGNVTIDMTGIRRDAAIRRADFDTFLRVIRNMNNESDEERNSEEESWSHEDSVMDYFFYDDSEELSKSDSDELDSIWTLFQ